MHLEVVVWSNGRMNGAERLAEQGKVVVVEGCFEAGKTADGENV